MLNSHVLDVLIGIVFIYLILSLICSAIMEMIAMLLSLRANTRKQWIERVLGKNLAEELYNHSLIYSLGNKGNMIWNWIERIKQQIKKDENDIKKEIYGFPSYIPANAFALALISTICKYHCKHPTNDRSRCNTHKFMNCLLEGKLDGNCKDEGLSRILDILKLFASESDRDVNKFIKSIEDWFNDAMDRVSGWYKRKSQIGIFLIALTIALALNLDTFQIAGAIYKDSVLCDALVNSAKNVVAANISQNQSFEALTAVLNQTSESVVRLNFYIGWKWNSSLSVWENLIRILSSLINNPIKIAGILATTFAAVIKAPIWFDLLSRFVRLRTTGEKPKDDKTKSS